MNTLGTSHRGYNFIFSEFSHNFFPKKESSRLNYVGVGGEVFTVLNPGGSLNELSVGLGTEMNFKNTSSLEFGINPVRANVPVSFKFDDEEDLTLCPALPAGSYHYMSAGVEWSSDYRKRLFLSASAKAGGFYNGSQYSAAAALNWRIRTVANIRLGAEYSLLEFPLPYCDVELFNLTPRLEVFFAKPDAAASNFLYRRGGVTLLPLVDGLPVVKPPYGRVTAIDLNRGEIRWTTPLGEGPRAHARLAHLNLPPLGAGLRGAPLATRTLLLVAMAQGGLGSARSVPVGDQPPSPALPPEPPKLVALDKATGAKLWAATPSGRPLAAPMTYLHDGVQYIVVATGLGPAAELVAYALEK